eukprot:INCI14780.10.p1 GENE.INCI14780.10~~INCI14780.10.p1  ORF type:complete len:341 (-),score=44.80 INCI14780.10:1639-2661(-)
MFRAVRVAGASLSRPNTVQRTFSSSQPPATLRSVGAMAAGVASGVVQGSAGVGGSIVMVAGLARFARLEQVLAVGSSMPTQVIAQAAGLVSVFAADSSLVHVPTAVCIAAPALVGVVVGVRIGSRMSDAALKLAFAALVLALVPPVTGRAIEAYNRSHDGSIDSAKVDAARLEPATEAQVNPARHHVADEVPLAGMLALPDHPLLHCACGAAVGVLSGAVGVGGGPLIVAFLAALPTISGWISAERVFVDKSKRAESCAKPEDNTRLTAGIAARQVGPTTNSVLLPMMMIGTLTHWRLGNICWKLLPQLGLCTAVGGALGGIVAVNAPEEYLLGKYIRTW